MNAAQEMAYQSARNDAAWYLIPESGCLRIEGEDRQSFLQRQTTNDVRRLVAGRGVLTVLTSPTARTLDVLYLLPEETAITVLTLPERGPATAHFLRSRIFFNDKVSLTDLSPAVLQIDLFGPQSAPVLNKLGAAAAPEENQVIDLPLEALTLRVVRLPAEIGLGYRLVAPVEASRPLQQALEQAGAVAVDRDLLEILRVEAGLPASGAELTEAYTPLESGLQAAISGSKGCYTGQEVIARQVTYDKVVQHLCGLRLEAPAAPGERVYTPGGDPAGSLTSAVISPRLGSIGLAILKRPHNQPGTALRLGSPQGTGAVVVGLPFAPGDS